MKCDSCGKEKDDPFIVFPCHTLHFGCLIPGGKGMPKCHLKHPFRFTDPKFDKHVPDDLKEYFRFVKYFLMDHPNSTKDDAIKEIRRIISVTEYNLRQYHDNPDTCITRDPAWSHTRRDKIIVSIDLDTKDIEGFKRFLLWFTDIPEMIDC